MRGDLFWRAPGNDGVQLHRWAQKNPVSDPEIQREYHRAWAQTGATEYRAHRILVPTEDKAMKLIAETVKGDKFEDIAQNSSKDERTRPRGGDLDWNVPGSLDKALSETLVGLEDVRPVNFPPLAQVTPQIDQRLSQQEIEALVRDLPSKAKVE